MYKHGDICPICGYEGLQEKSITERFEYKGQTKEIENYIVFECPECNESVIDKKTLKRSEKILRDFHREVDGLLTSKEIKSIRKTLGFTQKDFGLVLGGGEKGFARYESCAVTQSKSMDNLLRIVSKKPEVICILQKSNNHYNQTFKFSESFVYHYNQDSRCFLKIVGG
ncbi:MAG: type II toxin-antitoxin system MqsA family antitoxin [Desulfobacteraceae bacterium]